MYDRNAQQMGWVCLREIHSLWGGWLLMFERYGQLLGVGVLEKDAQLMGGGGQGRTQGGEQGELSPHPPKCSPL